jgi:GDP-4-dehydro-6-deoxy-D-mannose reductase
MIFLITGITGFLGPHLAKQLLENGHTVYGLLRGTRGSEQEIRDIIPDQLFNKIIFLYGDIIHYRTINNIMKTYKFDGIFHLAAQTHPPTSFLDPIGTWEANVMGSINLITAMHDNQPDCHFIFCSTVEVYGNEGIDERKIKETNTILPANPYGASKCAIDLYICERMKNKQLKATVVRPFCFTGPRRGARFSIASDAVQIAKMMVNKSDVNILKIGNLDTVRAVTDVRDIANAFYLVSQNSISNGKVYNVCGGAPLKMREYTNMLIKHSSLTNVNMEIDEKLWRPIDIQYQDGDASLIKQELNWEPTIGIEQTMQDLLYFWVNKIAQTPHNK